MPDLRNSEIIDMYRRVARARWALVFVAQGDEQPDAMLVEAMRHHARDLHVATLKAAEFAANDLARGVAEAELCDKHVPPHVLGGYYLICNGEFAAYDPGRLSGDEMLLAGRMLLVAFAMHLLTGSPMPAGANLDPVEVGRDRALGHLRSVIDDPVLGRDQTIAPYAYMGSNTRPPRRLKAVA